MLNFLMNEVVMPLFQHPVFFVIEALIVGVAIWCFVHRRTHVDVPKLTAREEEELIREWQPEPLVPDVEPGHHALNPRIVSSTYGKYIVVSDQKCLNLATHNYLGMAEEQECLEEAIKAVKTYGVGSCGPRGFFGTVDIHIDLEEAIAKFLGTEEAIVYSYGYAAISSAIPAYSKLNDIIFVDEGVNFAIQQGLMASRSTIRYFKHNDVADLARLLEEQSILDDKNPKLAKTIARFLVVEGLYINYGDICPLKQIVSLARSHKVRVFVDDTCGFGVLGSTGRGIVEHTGVDLEDLDLVAASLEYACGAYGGFCAGTHYVVDHQRLSGLGYCFSASMPPLQAAYAYKAIELIQRRPKLINQLHDNCTAMDKLLQSLSGVMSVQGDPISPIKHLRFAEPIELALSRRDEKLDSINQPRLLTVQDYDTLRLEKVVELAQNEGYCLTMARYLERVEHKVPKPSVRLIVSNVLEQAELNAVAKMLLKTFTLVQQEFYQGKF